MPSILRILTGRQRSHQAAVGLCIQGEERPATTAGVGHVSCFQPRDRSPPPGRASPPRHATDTGGAIGTPGGLAEFAPGLPHPGATCKRTGSRRLSAPPHLIVRVIVFCTLLTTGVEESSTSTKIECDPARSATLLPLTFPSGLRSRPNVGKVLLTSENVYA